MGWKIVFLSTEDKVLRQNIIDDISGNTGIIAHIGYPTKTFTAPKILNPCFVSLKAKLVVIPIGCKSGNLSRVMKGLIGVENFVGALITMPHKQAILSHLNYQSPLVKQSDSCNILRLNRSREIIGEMFDGIGVSKALREKGVKTQNKSVLLLGAGGVGSAVAFSIAPKGISKIAIFDLDSSKSNNLCNKIRQGFPNLEVNIWNAKEAGWDIIINATPLGMNGNDNLPLAMRYVSSVEVLIDLVLSNADTSLVQIAKENGSKVIAGFDILISQIPEMLDFFGLKKMPVKKIRTICGF